MSKSSKGSESPRGKLRVFFAEFDGDDATIQEGLRAISVAVGKTFQTVQPTKYIQVDSQKQNLTDHSPQSGQEEQVGETDEVIEVEAEPVRRPKPAAKRKPPTMSLVKELNLYPKKGKSLKDFFKEKAPKSQLEQVATCVYYLRRILEIDGVTANHVYTCLKEVGVRTPNDLPQILRNCAKDKGWIDTKDASNIQISNRGENLLEHELPKVAGQQPE